MKELEVINQQIELLHAKSSSGIPLDFTEVKMLESLVRSKAVITESNTTSTSEENPFKDLTTETLKNYLENLNKTVVDQEPN